MKGNQVVFQNPDMVDFQLREIEACIDNSVNAQYTLELSDQYGDNQFPYFVEETLAGQVEVGLKFKVFMEILFSNPF